jgi:hypothetical protein
LVDGAFDDADTAGQHLSSLVGGNGVGRREVGEVVGPLPNDLRIPDGAGSAADDAEPTVADLLAVAVRAVQNIPGPPLSQARDVRQLITQAGRDQHPPSADRLPTVEESGEPGPVEDKVGNGGVSDLAAVAGHLFAPDVQWFSGCGAVAREVSVQVSGSGVARASGVNDQDCAASPGQDQGSG